MSRMNPWEANALRYNFQEDVDATTTPVATTIAVAPRDYVHDTIIYPGLYAPSGFDMMSILTRVMSRPNPVVSIGAVDASCALIMCDLRQPDCPVVYASDAFEQLTGYPRSEVLGRNCRFLQAPPPPPGAGAGRCPSSSSSTASPCPLDTPAAAVPAVDRSVVRRMRRAVERREEAEVEILNFRRDGSPFVNFLTMIPVCWDSATPRYCVGFQAEKTW